MFIACSRLQMKHNYRFHGTSALTRRRPWGRKNRDIQGLQGYHYWYSPRNVAKREPA
jgi:hypothetical protein